MDQTSAQDAPSSLCCRVYCRRIATIPCTPCEHAPSTSGDIVLSPKYCSTECAELDWARHEVECFASRERRSLFDAGKRMQGLYYTACEMGLDFTVVKGYKVGTYRIGTDDQLVYDREDLQQRRDTVSRNEQFSKAFLACFGGYDPILKKLDHLTDHLQGLNVRVCRVSVRMKRMRGFSFNVPMDLAMDEHRVLKATTSNGESYALDVAGAQFGLYTAVVPWRKYVDLHVWEVQSSEDITIT